MCEMSGSSVWDSAELSSIYQTAPIGLCLTDLRYSFIRVNDHLAAMNGVPASSHIGRTIREVIPQLAPAVEPLMRRVIESGEPVVAREVRGQTSAMPGVERCWLLSCCRLSAPDGAVFAVSNAVLEAGTQRRAGYALRPTIRELESHLAAREADPGQAHALQIAEIGQLRDQLEHLTREPVMAGLAVAVATGVNQPLAAMVSMAQACRRLAGHESLDGDAVSALMTELITHGRRTGEAIHRLRRFLHKRSIEAVPVDVNAMVEGVAALFRSEAGHDGIELALDLAHGLPPVMGEFMPLEQLVLELLTNGAEAMTAMPPDSRRLVLATSMPEPGKVEVAVADHGTGLDPDLVARIFEPFFTTKPDGLGVGLSIGRAIMEAHHGALWATSNPEQGTTFRCSLPVMEAAFEPGSY